MTILATRERLDLTLRGIVRPGGIIRCDRAQRAMRSRNEVKGVPTFDFFGTLAQIADSPAPLLDTPHRDEEVARALRAMADRYDDQPLGPAKPPAVGANNGVYGGEQAVPEEKL